MSMSIDELWHAMDSDIADGSASQGGFVLRLLKPQADYLLYAAVEVSTHRRAVLLRLPVALVPSPRRWPRCRGLEPLALKVNSVEYFGITLRDVRFADVFSALVEDLARRVELAETPTQQADAFLGQLERWQKFLSATTDGLSEESQRGLWGELYFLREHLFPVIGPSAISGWKGPKDAHQDFQFVHGAVEVKATLATQPQVVRISSERQLDDQAWPSLYLYVIALDVRENAGQSLPAMIGSVRDKLSSDVTSREQFEDLLLKAGYLEIHQQRYIDRGYVVRHESVFHVRDGFPRLIENDLPNGVGDASYGLAIAACSEFGLEMKQFETMLNGMS